MKITASKLYESFATYKTWFAGEYCPKNFTSIARIGLPKIFNKVRPRGEYSEGYESFS